MRTILLNMTISGILSFILQAFRYFSYFCTFKEYLLEHFFFLILQSKQTMQSYVGPSPAELIQVLYDNRVCSYWLDVYWTYELCHGRYIMQYHDNKETQRNIRNEFYLGNYAREQSKLVLF